MKHSYLLLLLAWLLIGQTALAQTPPSGFTNSVVSGGWSEAVGLTFNSTGDQMFVWERPGKVWVVENGQRRLVLDISPEVGGWHDHGLLGFALHPQFDTNGYIYLMYLVDRHYLLNFGTPSYNPATNDYFSATIGRVTRYQLARSAGVYSVVSGSRTILIGATKTTGIASTERSHVTGSLVFGRDGTLLISTGDGASGASADVGNNPGTYYTQALADGIIQPRENVGAFRAQMVNCLNGKILRIDPLTGAGVPSNPYYDAANPSAPRSRVWALGLRNPFRMSLRPGTGSTDPAAANPGVLYVGDVGFMTWEEVSVVDRPRQNLGWPLYEGLTGNDSFISQLKANQDAPNPLFNQGGCTRQYFNFQDLLKQATPTGTATFANPCNTAQAIPASVPTFVQTRPLIDWAHGTGPSRTGTFSGSTATTANLGAAGSPVPGPQFGGSASVGGVFYPYADFPAGYQNSYFLGDYSGGWLRNMTVDAANKPTAVRNFIGTGAVVVGMAVHPVSPGLYYVNFPGEIRKVTYNSSNTAPTAVASADKQFGPAPLSVRFTGSTSSDPDGQTLSYLWNFGDGTTSPQADPTHVFSPGTSAPTSYTVTLTVTDPLGASNTATLRVSANNTPPQVTITSPVNNSLYPLTGPTTYNLRATVTDAEHGASQLSYAWQTFLHHESHNHPEPIDTAPQTTTTLDPLGCDGETYYYRIELTVTDAAGLATKTEVRLNPDCSTAAAYSFYRAVNLAGAALTLDGNAWAGSTAANYSTTGTAFANQAVPLVPATDATRAGMIRDAVYGPNLSISLTAVPAGTYRAYLTVWEDNDSEVYSLALNGTTVLANASTGPAGTWARLGPYPVTLGATGAVTFNASGGTVNCSGIELWQQTGGPAPANQAPVLAAIGNRTATVGQALTFTATATDPNAGQTLSYSLTGGVPAGAAINASTGAFSWTPTAAGTASFTVRVSDNGSPALSDEEAITVSVSTTPPPANQAPVLAAIGNRAATAGQALAFTASASDPDAGQTLSYSLAGSVPAGAAINASTGAFSWTPPAAGTFAFTVRVADNGSPVLTDEEVITVTVGTAPSGGQSLASYELINADTDLPIQPLVDGATLNLAALPTRNLNVRAITNPATVGSVVFALSLNGAVVRNHTETSAPYALFGDAGGNYAAWVPAVGSYALTARPFTGPGGSGTPGAPLALAFSVTNTPGGPATFALTTTVAPAGGGSVTRSTAGPNYAAGTVVSLTAVPATGFAFSSWSGDGASSANPLSVTMDANKTVTATFAALPPSGSFAFYRAVNLAGAALTLDGNAWAGSTAANYSTTGTAFANQAVPLVPATDAARAGMIRDAVYRPGGLSVAFTAVPAGTYQVFAYVFEDNNSEVYSLALNGTTVLANASTGPAGTWARLGPFAVTLAAPGAVTLATSGGTVNLSGIELWQQAGATRAALGNAVLAKASNKDPLASRPAVFPNPTPDGRVKVALAPEWLGDVSYTLYSALGAVVATGQQARTSPATALELDFHGRMKASGLYHLRLENAGRQTWLRIMQE